MAMYNGNNASVLPCTSSKASNEKLTQLSFVFVIIDP